MKKLSFVLSLTVFAVAMTVIFAFGTIDARADMYTGSCGANGDNLTWSFDSDSGILSIEGTGDMATYASEINCPWYRYRNSITRITFSDGITSIGERAFSWCSNILSVALPDSVKYIGRNAFYGCSSLRTIKLSNGLESIGAYAFRGCYEISSIEIPDSVVSIGEGAFYYCMNLTTVHIGNGITSIEKNTFANCTNMKAMTLYWGIGIKSVAEDAFDQTSISAVYISDIATWCNITYPEYSSNPLCYGADLYLNGTLLTDLVLTEEITSITPYAFSGCGSLVSVTIPGSIKTVSDYMFDNCKNLTTVNICEGVEYISMCAFCDSDNITEVTLPRSIKEIEGTPFNIETATLFVPKGSYAHSYAKGCYRYRIIYDVEKFTGACGANGYDITWTFDLLKGELTVSGVGVMASYSDTDAAPWLEYEESIETLKIEDGITVIGSYAFFGMTSLSDMTIPNSVTDIGEYAFCNCIKLTEITIPNGIKNIGGHAFENCYKVTALYFNATKMNSHNGVAIFRGAGKLTAGYNVIVGANVEGVPSYLFYDQENTNVNSSTYVAPMLKSVRFEEGSVCKSIGNYAFKDCLSLVSITLPNSIKNIGYGTFYNCRNLVDISFGSGIIEIGSGVFFNCTGLKSITLPNNVVRINNEAFYNCESLVNITGKGLRYIGDKTFMHCVNLENIDAPLLTQIGNYAFCNCLDLTHIELPDSITYLGTEAFSRSGLESVSIPKSIVTIPQYTFCGCKNLTEVNIPSHVVNIMDGAFSGSGLVSLTLPGSLKYFKSAFSNCTQLNSVTIEEGLTEISESAFYNCTGLTAVNMPSTLKTIGSYAFNGCTSLVDIAFPSGLTTISICAFQSCTGIERVLMPASITSIGGYNFYQCMSKATFYVYENSVAHNYVRNNNFFYEVITPDVDGDAYITNADIVLIVRYMSGWDVSNEIVNEYSIGMFDFNSDGKRNNRDILVVILKATEVW